MFEPLSSARIQGPEGGEMGRIKLASDAVWTVGLATSGVVLLAILGAPDSEYLQIRAKKPSTGQMPTVLESPAEVFVGYPGSIGVLSESSPDFTMAADGYTYITIVYGYPFGCGAQGSFRLDVLSGPVEEEGGVSTATDGTRESFIVIPTQQVGSCWGAVGYYRVPDEFNRGDDESLVVRRVDVQTQFFPASGGANNPVPIPIDLVRPPVVFVHGLWSGAATWTFPLATDATIPVREVVDYRSTNASSFVTNRTVVYKAIEAALARFRSTPGWRATRVDVVAHSMGGLLARIHSNSGMYATADNGDHGNVRKLITLDTPHRGSALANITAAIAHDQSSLGSVMRDAFRKIGMPIDEGAIQDLSVGSAAIQAIQASPVPAHALVGTGGDELLSAVSLPMRKFYTTLFLVSVLTGTDIFGAFEHDLVVDRTSQEGDLPSAAWTSFSYPDGIHLGLRFLPVTGNTGSASYSNRIRALLDTPVSDPSWSFLPAPGGSGVASSSLVAGGSETFDLAISSPTPGTVVASGSTILVTVVADPGVELTEVVVVGPGSAARVTSAPFQVSLEIPIEAYRDYRITAFGKNASTETYYQSQDLDLVAQPSATLQALQIDPVEAFIVGKGETLALSVRGVFSDGVLREVPPSEIAWTSLSPGVLAVDASGVVTALALGSGSIRAESQSLQATRAVKVLNRLPLIFAANFEMGSTYEWSGAQP